MAKILTLKHLCGVICIFLVVAEVVTAAPSYKDYESSIRDLYELLLQKDALDQRLGLHQLVRKSNRSPSLRLRFGRRSDPSLMPGSDYLSVQDQEQK